MKAPFPWFGGKSRVAAEIWARLGDVKSYIEPFFGSGAVFLNRPEPWTGVETINDFDGLVCNFWRAVQNEPAAVAQYADWPVNENDLHARHMWLVERKDSLQSTLEGDPDFYDPKIAGWWVWGMACWIGGEFCSGKGPWGTEEKDGRRQLVNFGPTNGSLKRRCVHLGAGRGVNRKRVHLSDAGQGDPGNGECGLLAWIEALSDRFRRTRVCCGDWRRVCGGKTGNALQHFFASGKPCGIFLDPPYADTAGRNATLYRKESLTVAHDVRDWAVEHGDDPRLRIVLCGYDGEHKMPRSWKAVRWKAQGGYSNQGDGNGKDNRHREMLWFSPHCLKIRQLCTA